MQYGAALSNDQHVRPGATHLDPRLFPQQQSPANDLACLLGPNSGWLNIHTLPSQLPDRLSSDDRVIQFTQASYFHGHALETCSLLVTGPLFSLRAKHVLSKHPLLVSSSPSLQPRLDPKTLSPSHTFPVSWPLSPSLGPWFTTIAIPLLTTLYHFMWQNPNPRLSSTLHTLSIHAAESGWGTKTKTVPHCLTVNPWPLTWVHPWH